MHVDNAMKIQLRKILVQASNYREIFQTNVRLTLTDEVSYSLGKTNQHENLWKALLNSILKEEPSEALIVSEALSRRRFVIEIKVLLNNSGVKWCGLK